MCHKTEESAMCMAGKNMEKENFQVFFRTFYIIEEAIPQFPENISHLFTWYKQQTTWYIYIILKVIVYGGKLVCAKRFVKELRAFTKSIALKIYTVHIVEVRLKLLFFFPFPILFTHIFPSYFLVFSLSFSIFFHFSSDVFFCCYRSKKGLLVRMNMTNADRNRKNQPKA